MSSERRANRRVADPTTQATRPAAAGPTWQPFVTPDRVRETGSTNADVLALAASGASEGTVIVAERQSAGRGRLGRRWLDHPGGSILCSMLFRPTGPIDEWHQASLVVALAAADAISEVAGVVSACKWPNDLLAGPEEQKVAGVLAEVGPSDERLGPALVVGIGINCNWPPDFPPPGEPDAAEIALRATSLDRLAGGPVDREAVLASMLERVGQRWRRLDPAALNDEYQVRCSTIGRQVRVLLAGEELVGTATGLDPAGRLLVDTGRSMRTVDAGDVVHLRPGGSPPPG